MVPVRPSSITATLSVSVDNGQTAVTQTSLAFTKSADTADPSGATTWALGDLTMDATAATFSGTLLAEQSGVSAGISVLEGSQCEAKYRAFPMAVQCTMKLGFLINSNQIYDFTMKTGAYLESVDSLSKEGEGVLLGYGADFPALAFPSMNGAGGDASYFVKKLEGVELVPATKYPFGDEDMMLYKTGMTEESSRRLSQGSAPSSQLCLLSLLSMIDECDACPDEMKSTAEMLNDLAQMVGADACLKIVLTEMDLTEPLSPKVKFRLDFNSDLFQTY